MSCRWVLPCCAAEPADGEASRRHRRCRLCCPHSGHDRCHRHSRPRGMAVCHRLAGNRHDLDWSLRGERRAVAKSRTERPVSVQVISTIWAGVRSGSDPEVGDPPRKRPLCPPKRPNFALVHEVREGPQAAAGSSSKIPNYSITSSARTSSVEGTSMSSALAVIKLMTNSNLVGCSTGRSEGFDPRKILST